MNLHSHMNATALKRKRCEPAKAEAPLFREAIRERKEPRQHDYQRTKERHEADWALEEADQLGTVECQEQVSPPGSPDVAIGGEPIKVVATRDARDALFRHVERQQAQVKHARRQNQERQLQPGPACVA